FHYLVVTTSAGAMKRLLVGKRDHRSRILAFDLRYLRQDNRLFIFACMTISACYDLGSRFFRQQICRQRRCSIRWICRLMWWDLLSFTRRLLDVVAFDACNRSYTLDVVILRCVVGMTERDFAESGLFRQYQSVWRFCL